MTLLDGAVVDLEPTMEPRSCEYRKKRNLLVNRLKVFKLKQDRGEPVRKFAGRVRSLASVSGYTVKSGATDVSYTEAIIRDQVIFGLADTEIQRDVLAHKDADKITLDKLLTLVEGKESSPTSQGLMSADGNVSAVDSKPKYCRYCGEKHPRGKVNCKAPGHICSKCEKTGHTEKVCRSNPERKAPQKSTASSTECSLFLKQNKDFMIYPDLSFKKEANRKKSIKIKERPARACTKRRGKYGKNKKKRTDPLLANKNVSLTQNLLTFLVGCTISTTKPRRNVDLFAHHVYDKESGRWTEKGPREKPYVKLKIEFDRQSASSLKMNVPPQQTRPFTWSGMCDTGASVVMAGRDFMRGLGIDESQATECRMSLTNADESPIALIGAVPVLITDTSTNHFTRQILYISGNASGLLLSQEACIDLGYISPEFPRRPKQVCSTKSEKKEDCDCPLPLLVKEQVCSTKSGKKEDCDCTCPLRAQAPDPPDSLPFSPTKENVPKLEQWIRDYYAASAFNCCECQPLPKMHGPPLKIFMQEGAKPVAAHSPIPIPLHWQEKVKAGLDRDEAIGVIEKVPSGTPTTWCHRMVVVPKKDNSPTVNFQPLN